MNINELNQDCIFFLGAVSGGFLTAFVHSLLDYLVFKDIKVKNNALLEENRTLCRKNAKLIRFIRERCLK